MIVNEEFRENIRKAREENILFEKMRKAIERDDTFANEMYAFATSIEDFKLRMKMFRLRRRYINLEVDKRFSELKRLMGDDNE